MSAGLERSQNEFLDIALPRPYHLAVPASRYPATPVPFS